MQLPAAEFSVLWDAMMQARAWDRLHTPSEHGMLTADQLLELCREAGVDEDKAQKAATARAEARMDLNLRP
jgi:hypothetical protein